MLDLAFENSSGEVIISEMSTFSLESPLSGNEPNVYETKRTTLESEMINEAINNSQGRNQQAKGKRIFSTFAHLCILDKEILSSGRENHQCINQNWTESEVRNTWLQETIESTNSFGGLEIENINVKKEALLSGDSKLKHTFRKELGDPENPTSVCAIETPIMYSKDICQEDKAVTLSKRMQEPKVTRNDQKMELSDEEFQDQDYIDQSLSIEPMAGFTKIKKLISSDITENSEPQIKNKNIKAADTDLVHKIKPDWIDQNINSLNSLTSEEITAQEVIEEENNKSSPSLWMSNPSFKNPQMKHSLHIHPIKICQDPVCFKQVTSHSNGCKPSLYNPSSSADFHLVSNITQVKLLVLYLHHETNQQEECQKNSICCKYSHQRMEQGSEENGDPCFKQLMRMNISFCYTNIFSANQRRIPLYFEFLENWLQ
ncbi:uncharacterized protein [Narcine bancroftii]|uniref:uncharacterized protein n=1 Tax=Narcine bancroftii TaxID=1343680 RepID=UPI0038313331